MPEEELVPHLNSDAMGYTGANSDIFQAVKARVRIFPDESERLRRVSVRWFFFFFFSHSTADTSSQSRFPDAAPITSSMHYPLYAAVGFDDFFLLPRRD